MNKIRNFLISFIGVGIIGFFASKSTQIGVNGWYVTAVPSALTPPNIWFRYIWTILYILMALAIWRISWQDKSQEKNKAQILFWTQLILHLPWCYTFFALGWIGIGFVVIIVMDIMAFLTIWHFKKLDKTAAYMLWPYFIWICYATILNLAYIVNNGWAIKIQ